MRANLYTKCTHEALFCCTDKNVHVLTDAPGNVFRTGSMSEVTTFHPNIYYVIIAATAAVLSTAIVSVTLLAAYKARLRARR